jgi:hypothetical protein
VPLRLLALVAVACRLRAVPLPSGAGFTYRVKSGMIGEKITRSKKMLRCIIIMLYVLYVPACRPAGSFFDLLIFATAARLM